jgi:L-alanine-DL-glutamate epimerase-like enolase superfamily enzyme
MKITHVKTRILSTPADNRLVTDALGADTPAPWGTREFVTVEVMTDEGVEGIGITFFGAALTKALKAAVDSLGELVVGEDPMRVEKVVAKLRAAASGAGPGGVFTLALSALDMALWDIKGKTLGVSVSQMAGGYRDRAPTYASGALLRQHGLQHLARVGPRLVEMGYRQMKSQMGAEPTPAASAERMRVLRGRSAPTSTSCATSTSSGTPTRRSRWANA